jgi:hypothetical protein
MVSEQVLGDGPGLRIMQERTGFLLLKVSQIVLVEVLGSLLRSLERLSLATCVSVCQQRPPCNWGTGSIWRTFSVAATHFDLEKTT